MTGSLFLRQLALGRLRWRGWSPAALAEARARDLPLLIIAGDALDHWTAALAAELVADHAVGELIEAAFVPVAIDVAAAPLIARRIQEALAVTADARGWPAVAVATPRAQPFGAVPFRPLRDRAREKGLARILIEIAERWSEARDDCLADAARLADGLRALGAAAGDDGRRFAPELALGNAEAAAMAIADPLAGGFGPAPRRLDAALLGFLVARCARADPPLALVRQVERTLSALAAGGAHDQLGGGFFAGATDAAWTVPFFEKPRRLNLALADVLERAALVFGRAYYGELAGRTRAFCAHAFPRGADDLGLHADSRDASGAVHAGAAYTWTADEIAALVGAEGAALVCRRFGVGAPGDIGDGDGRSVLAVRGELDGDEAQRRLPALMQRLAVARAEREPPPLVPKPEPLDEGAIALDPPPLQALDLDGVNPIAERFAALADAARDREAQALIAEHAGLMRRAPLSAPSLCLALEDFVAAGRWR